MLLDEVLDCLRCPVCGKLFSRAAGSLRCASEHTFDIARQGYVSLLVGGQPHAGDSAAMVAAREEFLGSGAYAHLAEEVAEAAQAALGDGPSGCVVDVGAGTGYYSALVLERLPDRLGIALDTSKFALRRAARAHPRLTAIGGDVWGHLPLGDGSAALILDIFAPRNAAEFRRVLHPDGALIVVTPTRRHLAELVSALGLLTVDERKEDRLGAKFEGLFQRVSVRAFEEVVPMPRASIEDLVLMGPTAWHKDPEALVQRIDELPEPFEVSVSVSVTTYRTAGER